MTVPSFGFDPLEAARRRAAEEAFAAAAQLVAQATELRGDRDRLVRALDAVRWRSDAARACREEGSRLAGLLARAADACSEAGDAARVAGERLSGERLAGERPAGGVPVGRSGGPS